LCAISSSIEVSFVGDTESVFLTLDGQTGIPMASADVVRMRRAGERLRLIQPARNLILKFCATN